MERVVLGSAFPLDWPVGYPRGKSKKRATFKATVAKARDQILRELRLMGVPDYHVIISSNAPISSRTMQMLAMKAEPADPGVAVYFRKNDRAHVLACDKWDRMADNLRALAMTLEAMRGLDRWGCSEMLDRVFQGFTALPPPPAHKGKAKPWHEVLGVDAHAGIDLIEQCYRMKMRAAHPDAGGTHEAAWELNHAITEARRARGA
jgi:hypothetical protein